MSSTRRLTGPTGSCSWISPHAIEPGSYTLTELRMAQERWPHPGRRVLPVMLEPTEIERVPAYLRAVTIFQPAGNVAAELAAHLPPRWRWSRAALLGGLGERPRRSPCS